MQAQTLKRPDGTNIAYLHTNPDADGPIVVYLHGLWSDKRATKAEHIAAFCADNNINLIRFDAYGHGESDGTPENFTLTRAVSDALTIIDTLTGDKPVIFMGSSMGGWVALRVMQERANKLAGIIGIAAAPDFTKNLTALSAQERQQRGYPDAMIDTGHNEYVLDKDWHFTKPVHLIQGKLDESVQWQTANTIAAKLPNATVNLIENGDHRLNNPSDLDAQTTALMQIYKSAV